MSCPFKVNSNTIELTVHTSCYWGHRPTLCKKLNFYWFDWDWDLTCYKVLLQLFHFSCLMSLWSQLFNEICFCLFKTRAKSKLVSFLIKQSSLFFLGCSLSLPILIRRDLISYVPNLDCPLRADVKRLTRHDLWFIWLIKRVWNKMSVMFQF